MVLFWPISKVYATPFSAFLTGGLYDYIDPNASEIGLVSVGFRQTSNIILKLRKVIQSLIIWEFFWIF